MAVPFLHNIDLNENQLLNAKVHTDTTAPSNPGTGTLWFDTNTNVNLLKIYRGGSWGNVYVNTEAPAVGVTHPSSGGQIVSFVSSGTVTLTNKTIDADSNTISNIEVDNFKASAIVIESEGIGSNDNDTTIPTSAAVKDYVDTQITAEDLDFAGDSGTGSIDLDSETLTIAGGTYITTSAEPSGQVNQLEVSHDATSRSDTTSTDAPSYGGTFEAVTGVTTNATGHVTAIDVSTVTIPASDNTDVDVSKANLKARLASMDSTDTVYIGDADDDTTVVIRGDLQVDGTTTTVNSETLTIDDNKIVLNSNSAATPTEDAGIEIERGDSTNVELRWNESNDDWEFQAYDHAADPALQTYGIPRSYKTTVGGSTSATVTHNLGTRDVIVQLYDTSSYDTVYADVVRTNTNTVTLSFGTAPSAGDVTVLVMTVG